MQINLEKTLSSKTRRRQYFLISKVLRAINELDVPEEEKREMNELGKDYLNNYDLLCINYHRRREKILSFLN